MSIAAAVATKLSVGATYTIRTLFDHPRRLNHAGIRSRILPACKAHLLARRFARRDVRDEQVQQAATATMQ